MKFEKYFYYFESFKTRRKTEKLADGLNKPAIFNMRLFLRELPDALADMEGSINEVDLYFALMQSESASSRDLVFRKSQRYHLKQLLKYYVQLVQAVSSQSMPQQLRRMSKNAHRTCRAHRLTGNSVEYIVWELLKYRKRDTPIADLQEVMEVFIAEQSLTTQEFAQRYPLWLEALTLQEPIKPKFKLFKSMMNLITTFEEDI